MNALATVVRVVLAVAGGLVAFSLAGSALFLLIVSIGAARADLRSSRDRGEL